MSRTFYDIHPDVTAFTLGRDEELPFPIVQMHQVHDVKVARVDSPNTTRDELQGYDALISNVPGVCIGARSADCIPVLLYDPVKKAAAAIHSGWRGTVTKVCLRTITRMELEYGTKADDLIALIGPGICMDCFQVGEEVATDFRKAHFNMNMIWDFRGPKIVGDISGGHHVNLPESCRQTLLESGIKPVNIKVSGICTYERTDILYSARKEGSECGRNITAIKIL